MPNVFPQFFAIVWTLLGIYCLITKGPPGPGSSPERVGDGEYQLELPYEDTPRGPFRGAR